MSYISNMCKMYYNKIQKYPIELIVTVCVF